MPIQSVNPATGVLIEDFSPYTFEEIETILHQATNAFSAQKGSTIPARSDCMNRVASVLTEEIDTFAQMMTTEMGKTLASAKAEVQKCALVCRYYAENAEAYLADEHVEIGASSSFKRYLPIGPVLAVMPWNFPFWQVFRFAAPALMSGNTVLLKHASNVPQCALAIESIFLRSGFPEGSFATLLIESGGVEAVLRDTRVRAVTLTGSGGAGAAVASIAGSEIKKSVLELGGSDPFIVMPSANMNDALDSAVKARIQNNGQSCIAAKRFIVHKDIYADFRQGFIDRFASLSIGDPMSSDTDIGPMATEQGRTDCEDLVHHLERLGGRRLVGAEAIEGQGYFYRPGIVEISAEEAHDFQDEIFGPVAILHKADSIEGAIRIGNDSPFGLGSAIYTQDDEEIQAAIRDLDNGATFVNAMVASHPHLPFGGVKASGYGRELSVEGIREFTNVKSVFVD